MAKKKTGPDVGTTPAGSLAPLDANEGKWWDGVPAESLTKLNDISDNINEIVTDAVNSVAQAKLKVGRLLLEARALITDDNQFGRWRQEKTEIKSKQEAHYLMQIADKFKNAPALVKSAPIGVLRELVTAPWEVVKELEDKAAKGAPAPSVRETRATVAEAKGKAKPEPVVIEHVAEIPPNRVPVQPQTGFQATINSSFAKRLSMAENFILNARIGYKTAVQWSYIIFGLDPDPSCSPNEGTIDALKIYYENLTSIDREKALVQKAYEHITYDRDHFQEG
jgi:hypothetical protein